MPQSSTLREAEYADFEKYLPTQEGRGNNFGVIILLLSSAIQYKHYLISVTRSQNFYKKSLDSYSAHDFTKHKKQVNILRSLFL